MAQIVKKSRLGNGTRVLFLPRADATSVLIHVGYAVGSRLEPPQLSGASHFIEHMFFKGTRRRPNSTRLARELDAAGAEFNAFTNEEETGYHIQIAADQADLALDMLADMLLHSLFRHEDVRGESKVIVQEMRKHREDPHDRAEDMLHEAAYPHDGLGRPIGGTLTSIRGLDRASLLCFRRQYYVPANCVITVAGAFDQSRVTDALERTFGQCPERSLPTPPAIGPRPPGLNVRYLRRATVEETTIQLGFDADCGREAGGRSTIKVLSNLLGGMQSSRLFEVVRDHHNLSYNPSAGLQSYGGTGLLEVSADVDTARSELAIRVIVDELLRIKEHGATAEEVSVSKRNLQGNAALYFENVNAVAGYYSEQELLCANPMPLEERLALVELVTVDDVNRAAHEVFRASRASAAIIARSGDATQYRRQLARLGE